MYYFLGTASVTRIRHLIVAAFIATASVAMMIVGSGEQAPRVTLHDSSAARAQSTTASGVIKGHVFAADTKQPLRRARVSLAGGALDAPIFIDTDDRGA